MADVRGRSEWEHTSAVLCAMANINRPKGKRAFKPQEFNPYHAARSKRAVTVDQLASDLVRYGQAKGRK